jgi:hypothetical protein
MGVTIFGTSKQAMQSTIFQPGQKSGGGHTKTLHMLGIMSM